jgi:putative ABC transport system permease protein
MPPLVRIAFRNVLRNRRRSFIAFLAIFLAITVTLSLRGLVNGMVSSMRTAVIQGQVGALQIHHAGFLKATNGASLDLDVPADEAFLARLRAVPGVRAVTARLSFGGMVNAHDVTSPALITAIDPATESRVCPQREQIATTGRAFGRDDKTVGVLTPALAHALGVKLGQTATLLTSDKDGALNALDFSVIGEYGQPGLPLPEKKFGFVPLAFAQDLLRMQGRATELAIAVDDLEALEIIKHRLQQVAGSDYEVSTWRELVPAIEDGIAAWRFLSSLFTGVFMFVALLGIVNTMLMSVFERTREIGTMMSLGARRRSILSLFLIEAAVLGCGGGLAGAGVGTAFVIWLGRRGLHFHMGDSSLHIQPWMDLRFLFVALLLATAGAVLAALWPAFRASRLRPVQALASV